MTPNVVENEHTHKVQRETSGNAPASHSALPALSSENKGTDGTAERAVRDSLNKKCRTVTLTHYPFGEFDSGGQQKLSEVSVE